MSNARHLKWVSLALLAAGATAHLPAAYAKGTLSATSINNTASVTYRVGTVDQTPVSSNTASFVVDTKIDLTVTQLGGAATSVNPGQTNRVVRFTVQNDGNAPQGFLLQVLDTAVAPVYGGGADNTDFNNLRVFVDSNGNGTYDAGVDAAVNIASLAPDAQATVFVVADVPLTAINGQFSNVRLIARAADNNTTTPAAETAGANTAGVDTVFGDGSADGTAARDATAQDEHQYAVQAATLSVVKSSAVIEDPFNLTVNPKAIPGATIEYTITITNASATAADAVVLEDVIPTGTDYQLNSMTLGGSALTDSAADGDGARYEAAPTPKVVIPAGSVTNAAPAVVKFRVVIRAT